MENLRIKDRNIYKIEVNDNGEFIEFDLADIGLKVKLYEALDKLDLITETYNKKIKECKTEREFSFCELDMFKELRQAMDTFLGEGACQKIFGSRNYYEMFDDLMTELNRKRPELKGKSHFDMLGFNAEQIAKRVAEKYKKTAKNVI